MADLLQLMCSVQPTAIIDSSQNSKVQIPNPKQYSIFKRKPTTGGLKGKPRFQIALAVGTWSFRDLYGGCWLNILYESGVELRKLSRVNSEMFHERRLRMRLIELQ